MRFNRVRRAANLIAAALLLFLFIVPSLYLARVTDTLLDLAAEAERAAQADDLPGAKAALLMLSEQADEAMPVCKLFMDHAAVDTLLVATESAWLMEEADDLLVAAAGIRAGVAQLRQVEIFSFSGLL